MFSHDGMLAQCRLQNYQRLCFLDAPSLQGRIFMTHPTKAVFHQLIRDFARGAKGSSDEAL